MLNLNFFSLELNFVKSVLLDFFKKQERRVAAKANKYFYRVLWLAVFQKKL